MSDSSLHTAIALALGSGIDEVERPAFGGRQLHDEQIAAITDAVLAVLAEPGEDVIERVARQLHQNDFDEDLVRLWGEITAGMRAIYRDETRCVLRAAFGGEQDVHLSK